MRSEKQLLLDEIYDAIDGSSALVLVNYDKLDPNMDADLRSQLRQAGGRFSVVPKRVFHKAAEKAGIEFAKDQIKGHLAVAYAGEDAIQATKALAKFGDDHEGVLNILAGYFDGKTVGADDVKAISKLPSKDEIRAQLLGLFEAPMAQTVAVLNAILTSVPHCLENKVQKEEK